MKVFQTADDYSMYLTLLKEETAERGVAISAYCLMPNHIHLMATPSTEEALAKAIGNTHRRFTRCVNMREKTTGYLFQGRFFSCPMDDEYFFIAARYIEQNPVRAGLCKKPWDYPWSSAAFHTNVKRKDSLCRSSLEFPKPKEWRELLQHESDGINKVRNFTRTGRPCGSVAFMKRAEKKSGRVLSPKKRGPKGRDD